MTKFNISIYDKNSQKKVGEIKGGFLPALLGALASAFLPGIMGKVLGSIQGNGMTKKKIGKGVFGSGVWDQIHKLMFQIYFILTKGGHVLVVNNKMLDPLEFADLITKMLEDVGNMKKFTSENTEYYDEIKPVRHYTEIDVGETITNGEGVFMKETLRKAKKIFPKAKGVFSSGIKSKGVFSSGIKKKNTFQHLQTDHIFGQQTENPKKLYSHQKDMGFHMNTETGLHSQLFPTTYPKRPF
jgi:hypothetical protein